jgi:methionine-rich copper-binding protein CopC
MIGDVRAAGRRGARLALAASLLLGPALLEAHAFLLKSVPARGARLSRPPQRVELIFNERLEPAYSTVAVWDAAGARVDRRDGAVTTDDARRLVVSVLPRRPGSYTVRFRVLSVDGHVVEADFAFTVR